MPGALKTMGQKTQPEKNEAFFGKYEAVIACHKTRSLPVVVKQIDNVLFSKETGKTRVLEFLHIINMQGLSALECKIR